MVVKDFLQHENPDIVMLQETKREVCDRRFVSNVQTTRNKAWTSLPTCGASGGALIIQNSKKLSNEEVVIGSFLVSIKILENERGGMLDNIDGILEEVLYFLKKLYTSPSGESWRLKGLDQLPIQQKVLLGWNSPLLKKRFVKPFFSQIGMGHLGRMILPLLCYKSVGI